MSLSFIPYLEIEGLLTKIRENILFFNSELTNSKEILEFQSALALQCFTNEYIYYENDTEIEALKDLEESVSTTLTNGNQPAPHALLCLASYKALNQYKWCDKLEVTGEIEEVYNRQVIEPNFEIKLKSNIPILEEITDKVSSKVRNQYEANPYPRWVNTELSIKPSPIFKVINDLNLKFFNEEIKKVYAPTILIAGCGTGQHSIAVRSRFKNSKVLAIDLSLSSLAYAKRKTEELGVSDIEYMQADILDLDKLDRKFDIIESVGVLHHMDNPLDGWRVLTSCLNKGGLMKVGLYSETARDHIVKIRKEIEYSGIKSNDIEMKAFRKSLLKSTQTHHIETTKWHDFYSLSEFRDLLFHVQEHRFTISKIEDSLSNLGLKFLGFEERTIVDDFKLTNPNSEDLYDLRKWDKYEKSNPNAFRAMYNFWCQKTH